MKKKSKLKKRVLQISALLLLVGLLVWFFKPNPIAVNVDEVRIGSFSAIVKLQGTTQARDHVILWAPVAGKAQRMPLSVGMPVVVKQVVARLVPEAGAVQDPQTTQYLNMRIKEAQDAKSRLMVEREKTAAAVNQAREQLRIAENAPDETAKAVQREQAQLAMRLIFKDLASMDAAIRSANLDLVAAEEALAQVKKEPIQEWEFRAPISGIVLAAAPNGKPVAIGETLAEIGNPMDLEVILETSTSIAAQVSAGQRVQVKPLNAKELSGRVRRVETLTVLDDTTPTRSRIAIELTDRPTKWQNLGSNHPVSASITIATVDNVVKVSAKALIPNSQQSAVFVIENGKAKRRLITLSERDEDTLVVERGLKEYEHVILNPGPDIKDGARVRVL